MCKASMYNGKIFVFIIIFNSRNIYHAFTVHSKRSFLSLNSLILVMDPGTYPTTDYFR